MDVLRRAIGLADLCELASAAFAFPTRELAAALSGGSFAEDCRSCLEDAGLGADVVEGAMAGFRSFEGRPVEVLFDLLRKGSSLLFFAPGGESPVWPYEAAFLFAASGREGEPTLFRTACQLDVEKRMREAGVLPKDARTEPSDSVWNELSFMSYLYGSVAKALHEGRGADAAEWSGRIVHFWDEHAVKWLPAFMEKTVEEAPMHSYGAEYAILAEVGLLVLGVIREDVELRKVEA